MDTHVPLLDLLSSQDVDDNLKNSNFAAIRKEIKSITLGSHLHSFSFLEPVIRSRIDQELSAKREARFGLLFWTMFYISGSRFFCRTYGLGLIAQSATILFFVGPNFYHFFNKFQSYNNKVELLVLNGACKRIEMSSKKKSELLREYEGFLKEQKLIYFDRNLF